MKFKRTGYIVTRQYSLYFAAVFSAVIVHSARAATITANDCGALSVQRAINGAFDRDTVLVPPGEATWETPVEIREKSVVVKGSGPGKTVIIDGTTHDWDQTPFNIHGGDNKPWRITGFTFKGNNDSHGFIQIRGNTKNWRIDHCIFDSLPSRCINIRGHTYGVIDHCDFIMIGQNIICVRDENPDASWRTPLALGTADAVYVEDCFLERSGNYQGNCIDGNLGGRFVVRYNTIHNASAYCHGTCNTRDRGTFSYEIYGNRFTSDGPLWYGTTLRGGTGVIFDNRWEGTVDNAIAVVNYRTCQDAGNDQCGRYGWNRCDGTSPVDGNEDETGYPCLDQIGRSTDQSLEPLYEWNNTINGKDADIDVINPWKCENPSMDDHIKEGRDFYTNTRRPGYSPYPYPHPLTRTGEKYGEPKESDQTKIKNHGPANLRICTE
ncbi:MAG: hypothetical protein GF401_00165 [Chitinivibrionales bacterium]|nr:hypothetical protein [Chitinivibrionales bacterium]